MHTADHASEDEPVRRLSDVEVVRVVGTGSMGEVCFAQDHELLRDVAFKRLKRREVDDVALRRAIEREARIAAQLDHPNIVPIYRMQRGPSGEIGYVMKFVQGETLSALIQRAREHRDHGQLHVGEQQVDRIEIFLRIVDALAYAHSKGVVHRDIKPDNVLLGEHGTVYLADWGLAKIIKNRGPLADLQAVQTRRDRMSSRETEIGQLIGTIAYMSPEQANGHVKQVGPTSDVFSLGLLLYELLYLKHPYPGTDVQEMMNYARAGKVVLSSSETVDLELLDIARKATAIRPEERYPDASAFAADLRRWRSAEATEAGEQGFWPRIRRMLRRRPDHGITAVFVLLLIDFFLLLYYAVLR